MRIVISEFIDPVGLEILRAARAGDDIVYDPALVDSPERLAAEFTTADAVIVRNRTQVRGALLGAARGLRVVGRLGVGLDNIDTDACAARNIDVFPATGANADAVAEYVIAVALLLVRGAYASTPEVAGGGWPRLALAEGGEIAGRTLGLIGFGDIARRVARRASGLGMHVAAFDPILDPADPAWSAHACECLTLHALLERADVVSLHVPLTDATRGMLDASGLARMRPGAILVNTARGGIVDEPALADALRAGRLGGAAIDVFDQEPVRAGDCWSEVPNLILTPHIAGLTRESNVRVSRMVAERVSRRLDDIERSMA
ncbi:MAG: hydroxyacid dehydrogenase [Burkholderiaceae bacterium]